MVAITFRETLRHWARLFGYFLGVAVVGGAIAGGGLVLLRDVPGWLPGGQAPDVGAKLIAGAGLLAGGVLVLLAGFFTIVLVVVADGVRFGVEAATDDRGDDQTDDGSADEPVPDPCDRLAMRRRARRTPVTEHAEPRRPRERTRARPAVGSTVERQGGTGGSDTADRGEDWMREVERDLADEGGEDVAQTASSDEPTVPPDGTDPTDRPPEREPAPPEERVESPAEDWERPASEGTDGTPNDRDEGGTEDWVGADEIESGGPTADGDTTPARDGPADRDGPSVEGTDVAPERDESTAGVADEPDVTAGDRPSTESDGPVDDSPDATEEGAVSDDAPEPAGGESETTAPGDDPLAPGDFEPEPVEPDAAEPAEGATDSGDDSVDSDDERQ